MGVGLGSPTALPALARTAGKRVKRSREPPLRGWINQGSGRDSPTRDMQLDPNTHAFVLATAFFTSLFFAMGAFLPVALFLHWLVFGAAL